jgi:iron complex outermembrane receptor protein
MLNGYRSAFAATTSAIALCTGLSTDPALAQDAAEAVIGLEEIIVNARRVEENLQRVPVTVVAYSSESLASQDSRDLAALSVKMPGLNINANPGGRVGLTPPPVIRGVPGLVGYFADSPTQLSGYGLFFDLANVQLLKGPQGTLFGLSTNGGAILYQPKKPSEKLEGYFEATAGNYGRLGAQGAINIPLMDDKLLVRIGAQKFHSDGWVKDVGTGVDYMDQNYWIGRASVVFRPTDTIENYFLINYYKFHGHGNVQQVTPGTYDPLGTAALVFGASLDNAALAQQALGLYRIRSDLALNGGSLDLQETYNIVDTLSVDITDDVTLKNIFGYQLNKSFQRVDFDGLPLALFQGDPRTPLPPFTRVWTNETQLLGKIFDERLSYQVGVFQSGSLTPATLSYSTAFGNTSAARAKSWAQTRAVYAQGTYDLSDFLEGLSFTAGYRYTWDIRAAQNVALSVATLTPTRDVAKKAHFSAGSYTFGFAYQYSPDTMFYLTDTKGYSSGGLTLTAPVPFDIFYPETLNSLETGVKSQWSLGGMTARTNFGAYYGWYTDVQVTTGHSAQLSPPPAPPTLVFSPENAATARVYGLDGEITVLPTERIELSFNFAYNKSKYTRWQTLDNAGNPIDVSGTSFLFSPKMKYTLRAAYHLPTPEEIGNVSIAVNWSHVSAINSNGQAGTTNLPGPDFVGPYGLMDINLDWTNIAGFEALSGAFFVTNVLDLTEPTVPAFRGYHTVLGFGGNATPQPRQFGIRMRYSF